MEILARGDYKRKSIIAILERVLNKYRRPLWDARFSKASQGEGMIELSAGGQ